MYLEYFSISCWFFSPHVAFALEAFVHLYAAAKRVLFSIQSNMKSVDLGTLPVLNFYHQTPWVFFSYPCAWKHDRVYMKNIWKSGEFVWNMWRIFQEKLTIIRKNAEFDWASEEFIWQKFGKVKNFYGNVRDKNDEFPWKNDQSWDARGSQNFNSIFFVGGGPYIYIYML